jgi:hypothetical protein
MTKELIIERINNDFVYHAPFGDQVARYASLREAARELAIKIVNDTPISREQSLALTHLEEAVFYANAAIARNEKRQEPDPNTLYPDMLTTEYPKEWR